MPPLLPRVSIGLPVHKGERLLKQTLDPMQSKDLDDWDLVIVDNASTVRIAYWRRQALVAEMKETLEPG